MREVKPTWTKAAQALTNVARQELGALGDETVRDARNRAPKGATGKLRGSIRRRLTALLDLVGRASARHARIQNQGGTQPGGSFDVQGTERKAHTRFRKPVRYRGQRYMRARVDLLPQYGQKIVQALERALFS